MIRILLLFLFSIRLFAYEFEISIATMFRDEAPFLKEWIEFHRLIGVEHFYLYNNCSQDNFLEVLGPYIKEGIVELFDVPTDSTTRRQYVFLQRETFIEAVKKAQGISKWVAFVDTDEFIFPVQDKTLPHFLSHYEKYGGVTVNWHVFGTSDIQHLEKDKLMIEQLVFRAKTDYKGNGFVKSIVQVDFVDTTSPLFTAHVIPLIKGSLMVNPNEQPRPSSRPYSTAALRDDTIPTGRIRIHHYQTRDKHFLHEVKLTRVNGLDPKKRQEILDIERDSNEIEDRSLLIYAEELKKAVF